MNPQHLSASERIARGRSRLLLDQPWFGSLALRLRPVETDDIPTMATDGTRLLFNPVFTCSLTEQELLGVLAHEIMHCALLHPYRTEGRDMGVWNRACDYAINPLLTQRGFMLPNGCLNDPAFAGLAAEQIYARIMHDPDSDKGSANPGIGEFMVASGKPEDNGQADEPADMPGDEANDNSSLDWQIAAAQATAVANKAGKGAGDGIDREIRRQYAPQSDLPARLRQFVEQVIPSDYAWSRPNRRLLARGIYMPGLVRENAPRLVAVVDTSGSVNQDLLAAFGALLEDVISEVRPEQLDVIYCDDQVQGCESFAPGDAVEFHAEGGYGTAFQPAFDHVADDPPVGMIYFTDLEGPEPLEPEYPVLWVTPAWVAKDAWFGETVRFN